MSNVVKNVSKCQVIDKILGRDNLRWQNKIEWVSSFFVGNSSATKWTILATTFFSHLLFLFCERVFFVVSLYRRYLGHGFKSWTWLTKRQLESTIYLCSHLGYMLPTKSTLSFSPQYTLKSGSIRVTVEHHVQA